MVHSHRRPFVAVGHIVNDTEPINHVGGSVVYAAIAAHRLGREAHIITKIPPNHQYVSILRNMGIIVHTLPTNNQAITTFSNRYSQDGKRQQICQEQQELISRDDFSHLALGLLDDAVTLIAPVTGEIEIELFPFLKGSGPLGLSPQGYLRSIGEDGQVTPHAWNLLPQDKTILRTIDTIIVSEEDLTINGTFDSKMFELFRNNTTCTILTKGKKGSVLYSGNRMHNIPTLSFTENEIGDHTGAGDVYAAAFLLFIEECGMERAAYIASVYAALKVYGFGKKGIDSILNKNEVLNFFQARKMLIHNTAEILATFQKL